MITAALRLLADADEKGTNIEAGPEDVENVLTILKRILGIHFLLDDRSSTNQSLIWRTSEYQAVLNFSTVDEDLNFYFKASKYKYELKAEGSDDQSLLASIGKAATEVNKKVPGLDEVLSQLRAL